METIECGFKLRQIAGEHQRRAPAAPTAYASVRGLIATGDGNAGATAQNKATRDRRQRHLANPCALTAQQVSIGQGKDRANRGRGVFDNTGNRWNRAGNRRRIVGRQHTGADRVGRVGNGRCSATIPD